jgi:deoxyribonuclease IV
MSIAGGAHMAIERARSIGCTAMQIFVKNNMQWFARPLRREEIRVFLNHRQRRELLSIFAHANYLINLAATNPQFHANSLRSLSEELTRADQFELPFLVLHPGAHLGTGEDAGLDRIVASIDTVFAAIPKVKTRIALETTAGQGSCLGHTFEQTLTSSAKCARRSAFAFVSIPHTFSPPDTTSGMKQASVRPFAISIARSAAIDWPRFT